jgi:hypothetical protein
LDEALLSTSSSCTSSKEGIERIISVEVCFPKSLGVILYYMEYALYFSRKYSDPIQFPALQPR